MSRYLTEEEVNNLEKMGLSENEIKKIKEILKWYHKKGSNLDVEINGEAILKLSNLKDLLKEPEVYGVSGSGILRELVLRKLDSENSDYEYKDLCTATIWNSAPDYVEMGGTQFYRIYLKKDSLKLYCLDNFFRLVQIRNIKIEEIRGCTLKDRVYFEGKNFKIYYIVLDVEERITNGKYYMYSMKKMEESTVPELYKRLKEKGVAEFEYDGIQSKARTSFARYLLYGIIIIAVLLIISSLINYL